MAALPREIEITENGTPEHNRVKIKVVLNNIHYVHYKKIKRHGKTSDNNDFDFLL